MYILDNELINCHTNRWLFCGLSYHCRKKEEMLACLLLYYLSYGGLEEPKGLYGARFEETETEELLCFIKRAVQEVERRGILLSPPIETIRVTKTLRVFVGRNELKIRPMAKTILLLFLKHPEGIALKQIASYESELAILYRRVSRSSSPAEIEYRVKRILDLFNNDLNVNIARVNRAVAALVDNAADYRIVGFAGCPKRILLDRKWVVWE